MTGPVVVKETPLRAAMAPSPEFNFKVVSQSFVSRVSCCFRGCIGSCVRSTTRLCRAETCAGVGS
eukprot:3591873-Amphidinium_carterae.1